MSKHPETYDTNCGPGMVYDSPDEKEIYRLTAKLKTVTAERNDAEAALREIPTSPLYSAGDESTMHLWRAKHAAAIDRARGRKR